MVTLNVGDKEYNLTFTRASVRSMEKAGFVASDITDKPATMIPDLFAGAFIANHKFVKRDVIDRIFEKLKGKEELVSVLTDEYNKALLSMFDEPEDDEGNVTWAKSE